MKSNAEVIELLGAKPKDRWFGGVECKDHGDWVKCCVTVENHGNR